ncbi:MAG: M24 family metallopeptidase [Campylobacterales bacterium]
MRNALFCAEPALLYELGYSCDNGIALLIDGEKLFITDSRYTEEAREILNPQGIRVIESYDIIAEAARIIRLSGEQLFWIDPKEWNSWQLERLTLKSRVRWHKVPDLSKKRRRIKRADEISKLKIAAGLGAEAFEALGEWIASEGIGCSERMINKKARTLLSNDGERPLSFEPITAINANASKPHARVTDTILHEGDLLLIDAGLKFQGYCSDRTRTVVAGRKMQMGLSQHFSDALIQRAYDTLRRAQEKAIGAAKPGMKARELDLTARQIITEAGFGDYFIHSLGHGVGLEIHELPVISKKSNEILEEGMVFTIEPGIYIPGHFGIRLEEMVLLESSGAEVL